MESSTRGLRSLPVHVTYIAHEIEKTDINGIKSFKPDFQGQFKDKYAKHFSLIMRYFMTEGQVPDANGKMTVQQLRYLNCLPDSSTPGKDRSWGLQKYEDPNLGIDNIFAKMTAIQ